MKVSGRQEIDCNEHEEDRPILFLPIIKEMPIEINAYLLIQDVSNRFGPILIMQYFNRK